jgi:hypothetical protein
LNVCVRKRNMKGTHLIFLRMWIRQGCDCDCNCGKFLFLRPLVWNFRNRCNFLSSRYKKMTGNMWLLLTYVSVSFVKANSSAYAKFFTDKLHKSSVKPFFFFLKTTS